MLKIYISYIFKLQKNSILVIFFRINAYKITYLLVVAKAIEKERVLLLIEQ